jgi:hypothetical protein
MSSQINHLDQTCISCDIIFTTKVPYYGATPKCIDCRSSPIRRTNCIITKLKNAEIDAYGWSYMYNEPYDTIDFGDFFRYKKDEIRIGINSTNIYFGYIQLMSMGDMDEYINATKIDDHKYSLNMSCNDFFDILTIEDYSYTSRNGFTIIHEWGAMTHSWGKNIVRKQYRHGFIRLILLRIYILRYIRYLRHVTYMPCSIACKRAEKEFNKLLINLK